jgi:5'-nucleotidase
MKKIHLSHRLALFFTVLTLSIFVSAQTKITVLHTNDTHSQIEPIGRRCNASPLANKGGYIRRATFVEESRKQDQDLLLFDCGDFSQGSPYYSLFRGQVEIQLMNVMKYDAVTIGNHEFDFGMENLLRLVRMAKFPFVCSNYDFSNSILKGQIKKHIILHRKGIKIGIFGLSPNPKGLISEKNCIGVTFKCPIEVANEEAKYLKEEGCDVVICLSHLGSIEEEGSYNDPLLIQKTKNIDMVLGGHSHTYFKSPKYYKNIDNKKVMLTQMGSMGAFIGKVTLTFE